MASDFFTINLNTALQTFSVEGVTNILSTFSCVLNNDIERFLKERAIEFSNKGIARTHLVLRDTGTSKELLGYYTLANKVLAIPNDRISNAARKRIERFGVLDTNTNAYNVPMPLIAQLGKNYSNELNKELDGSELLLIACDKVAEIQDDLGGRFVYIECEGKIKLIDFYNANGFRIVSDSKDETGLVQMILFQ